MRGNSFTSGEFMSVRLAVAGADADAELADLWDVLEQESGLGDHLALSRGRAGTYDMSAGSVTGILVTLQPGVATVLSVAIREFCRRPRRKPGIEITVDRPGTGSVTVKTQDTNDALSEALMSVTRLLEAPAEPEAGADQR